MRLDHIYQGNALAVLKSLPSESVHCVVTSPPYWGLRDYGLSPVIWDGDPECVHEWTEHIKPAANGIVHEGGMSGKTISGSSATRAPKISGYCSKCGAWRGSFGLEPTLELYIQHAVSIFREVRRVLRRDGLLWLNLGDAYAGTGGRSTANATTLHLNYRGGGKKYAGEDAKKPKQILSEGLKPKDMVGIPWRMAFALQADGWWLRSDIIWCLSGGTWVYTQTQKGDMPMMVRDMARLNPKTVKLWNGEKWTQLLGVSRSRRKGNELEIVLRSGERISCTPTHQFPTGRGLLEAADIRPGDVLVSCRLPEPTVPRDCAIDEDAAWFAGLYIAEGSMSRDTIQISGHAKEDLRYARLLGIARKYGGTVTRKINGNCMNIRLWGKVLNAILAELVTGHTAHKKGFSPSVWKYSDRFIAAMVDGYLSGDGCKDENRWRLCFCRNYNLERDLRTACARLGYKLTLNLASTKYCDRTIPTFRGELRTGTSGHHNEKDRNEVLEIRKARCREVYDIGVADFPHLFALASGVLTHNSKPAPMPESVTDRPTKSHEYIFLMSKAQKYFYDHEAVKELSSDNSHPRGSGINKKAVSGWDTGLGPHRTVDHARKGPKDEIRSEMGLRDSTKFGRGAGWRVKQNPSFSGAVNALVPRRNLRTVWTAETDNVFSWFKWISEQPEFEALRKRYTDELRNIRDVWTINTEPFPGSHFAVFPQRLVEPCILAGTSEKGCCPECGAPWVRITEKQPLPVNAPQTTASGPEKYSGKHSTTDPQAAGHRILASMKAGREAGYDRNNSFPPRCTIGWKSTCSHDLPPVPCTVLDPFSGSGTVAVVAKKLNRHFVGIEMNPSYISMAWNRLEKEVGLLLLGKEACENREEFEIAMHSQVLQAHS